IGAWEIACEMVNMLSEIKFQTVEFIEIDSQAQKVLRSHFPQIPIHSDVRSYAPKKTDCHLISFPCTGTSVAGKKEGLNHEESNLWFEALRCIVEGKPKYIAIEQPEGFIDRGLRSVLDGLRMAGYQTEVELISAAEFGAPHRRNRVFVVAHTDDLSLQQREGWTCWSEQIGTHIEIAKSFAPHPQTESGSVSVADGIPSWLDGIRFDGFWLKHYPQQPGIARRTRGRRDCVSLYGRSIVPLCAVVALMRIQFLGAIATG
nr:DNA cytosine methyltransferase [Oscillatoriaceae cyanobacterium Prado104]